MSDATNPAGNQSLGIGSIIGESFSLCFKNFLKLLLIMIVPIIVVGAVNYLLFAPMIEAALVGLAGMANAGEQMAMPVMDVTLIIKFVASLLLMILAYCFLYGAIITAIFDAKAGRGVNIGKAMGTGVSRAIQLFVSLLVLEILLGIVIFIISLVLGLIMQAVASPVVGILVIIVMIAIYLYIFGLLLPFPATVVVENLWVSAIGRTMALTKGYRWWIVLLMFLFGLAATVLYAIVIALSYVLIQIGPIGLYITFGLGIISAVILGGASIALITLTYARLREIKEGTSVETLAQVFD